MAKRPRDLEAASLNIPPEVMEEARRAVQMEAAKLLARKQMGLEDEEPEATTELDVNGKKRAKRGPPKYTGEMYPIMLDLAPYCDRITLDGTVFLHGRSYSVSKPVFETLQEIQSRTWSHQAQIDGKSENFYRKQQQRTLSGLQHNTGVTA